MNYKTILKTFFIDIVFLFILYGFFTFIKNKIQDYISLLTSLNLDELQKDVTNVDLMKVNFEVLNSLVSKIFFFLILALVVAFLLYCLFQSLNWNLAFNNKLKNYKKYFLRFLLINIPIWVASLFILFKILFHARGLIITTWVKETYLSDMGYGSFPAFIFYMIILMAIGYFAVMSYTHLNKNKFLKSVKLSFKEFTNYKLILKYLGLWLVFALLLFTIKIHPLLWFVLALIQIQFCRIVLNAGVMKK